MPREDLSPVAGEQSIYKTNACLEHTRVSDRKEYAYTLLARPYGEGTQPEYGFIRHQDSGSVFGQVVFDNLLSPGQCRQFDLRPDSGLQELVGNTYVCIAPSGQKVACQLSVESYDVNTGAFQVSRGFFGAAQTHCSMDWQDMTALLESHEWYLSLQDHYNPNNL